jgi:hypothetical protein
VTKWSHPNQLETKWLKRGLTIARRKGSEKQINFRVKNLKFSAVERLWNAARAH